VTSAHGGRGAPPLRVSGADPTKHSTPRHVAMSWARRQKRVIGVTMSPGMPDPVNVTGTDREYPNWQLKLPDELEELENRADLTAAFSDIDRVRAELTR